MLTWPNGDEVQNGAKLPAGSTIGESTFDKYASLSNSDFCIAFMALDLDFYLYIICAIS